LLSNTKPATTKIAATATAPIITGEMADFCCALAERILVRFRDLVNSLPPT